MLHLLPNNVKNTRPDDFLSGQNDYKTLSEELFIDIKWFFFFSFNANRLIDKNNTLLLTNFNLNDNFLLFNPVALDNSSGVDVSLINSLRIR